MKREFNRKPLAKTPTGIKGLDEITQGGLPYGRPTIICGAAGSGKTLVSLEFLVRGATEYNEPGVFIAFEETEQDLIDNVSSLGFDLKNLIDEKLLYIDYVFIERSEIEETGEYDLEGLFVRINSAIETIGAKRIAIDTLEALFAGLSNAGILRSETRRLFRWLKDKEMTAIITGEQGENTLTRHGLEEYVSDCVISLSHLNLNNTYTRRMRIVKYRGTKHETSDFPFLIDDNGISVLPITSISMDYVASEKRISSGIDELDEMFEGKGFYRGSSVLVSGTAGTGKTSLCGHMAEAACKRGEKVLFVSMEESASQIMRNLKSIGLDLKTWVEQEKLHFYSERVTMYGLEAHLTQLYKFISTINPTVVIIDPINAFMSNDNLLETKSMIARIMDYIKSKNITGFFSSLTAGTSSENSTDIDISSWIDTWILLRDIEENGEKNRGIYILKSRGMANSNQVREFLITSQGVKLQEVYVGTSGILTGSSRLIQELEDREEMQRIKEKIKKLEQELERKEKASKAQIELAQMQHSTEKMQITDALTELKQQLKQKSRENKLIANKRNK